MNKYRENVYLFLEELKMEEGEERNWSLTGSFFSVLFSLCREKSTKRAPLKESTHGTFLKDPFPLSARHFAYGEMANALSSRSLP